jgi:ADP-ribosyl-[dinitrogen reductase] hydrolase
MAAMNPNHQPILGCLLGGAIGDALGAVYEGCSPPVEIDPALRGILTDDTQLTLATCEAIVEARGVDPAAVAARLADWFRAGRINGIGASTYKALSELAAGGHWALVGRRGEMAAGNGAAMRIAPLAFWLDPADYDQRRTLRDVCRITHHNDEAYVGASAILVAVRAAWKRRWTGEGDLLELVIPSLPDSRVRDRLAEFRAYPANMPIPDIAARHGSGGYVVESVPLAILAAGRVHGLGFERMLTELVISGGDTDTTASMAGQIAGALVGHDGLPEDLLANLPDHDLVLDTATRFAGFVGERPQ